MTQLKIKWEYWQDATEIQEEQSPISEEMEIVTFMVRTPLGIFSPNDPFLPSRMFECWVGHTNFEVTKDFLEFVGETEGVEVAVPMSRYRFFIGVGKSFNFTNVRTQIQLGLQPHTVSVEEEFNIEFEKLKDKPQWAIFVGNDGKITSISSDLENDPEYDKEFKKLDELENGILINNLTKF